MWKLFIVFAYWNPAWPHDRSWEPPPRADHYLRYVQREYSNREACERMEGWLRANSETNPPGETDDSWYVMLVSCQPPANEDLTS